MALLPNWSAGASTTAADVPSVNQDTRATFQRLADAVLTDRTEALVDARRSTRHRSLNDRFSGEVRISSGVRSAENSAVSELRGRKSRLAALGEKYSDAKTSVSLDKTVVRGRHAIVDVTETTTLTYGHVRGDEPRTTGFQARHELRFSADRHGNWQLTKVRSEDEGYAAVNQPSKPVAAPAVKDDGMPAAARAAITWPAPSATKKLTGGAYDYKAMASYAEKYWSNYNPAYPNYNSKGGDCTNFVSQALRAGGWKDVTGSSSNVRSWFSTSAGQSASFVGVNELSWFTLNSKRATNLANVYQMGVGDVLQMDFNKDGSKDHAMIVTYRSARGVPYLTYHSTNTYRRSVASIIASYPNSAYYAYRT
ncbi:MULTISPECIES: amidase domain-containing protein [unclassified Streptomyces]|uniref:amidase domain-containing protein n=1 Tax=unclassified Streptomyces TaxID=2593676 RepID=UPI00344BE0C3